MHAMATGGRYLIIAVLSFILSDVVIGFIGDDVIDQHAWNGVILLMVCFIVVWFCVDAWRITSQKSKSDVVRRAVLHRFLRIVATVVLGTVAAQFVWIWFATRVVPLSTEPDPAWYLVMVGIHVVCWMILWRISSHWLTRSPEDTVSP